MLEKHHLQLIVLFVFCVSFLLTTIFLSAPIDRKLIFDSFQNEMNSIFLTITGGFLRILFGN